MKQLTFTVRDELTKDVLLAVAGLVNDFRMETLPEPKEDPIPGDPPPHKPRNLNTTFKSRGTQAVLDVGLATNGPFNVQAVCRYGSEKLGIAVQSGSPAVSIARKTGLIIRAGDGYLLTEKGRAMAGQLRIWRQLGGDKKA